jgi:hypothetical protein
MESSTIYLDLAQPVEILNKCFSNWCDRYINFEKKAENCTLIGLFNPLNNELQYGWKYWNDSIFWISLFNGITFSCGQSAFYIGKNFDKINKFSNVVNADFCVDVDVLRFLPKESVCCSDLKKIKITGEVRHGTINFVTSSI